MKENELTIKQKRFADEYLIDLNATQSAIRAGYSKKTADVQGSRLLANAKVSNYIEKKLKEKDDELIAKEDEVLKYLTSVMRGEEKDAFGLDASLQDRTKCAELLGRRYGAFKENVSVTGNIPVVIVDDITE